MRPFGLYVAHRPALLGDLAGEVFDLRSRRPQRALGSFLALAGSVLPRGHLGFLNLPVHTSFPRRFLFGLEVFQERPLLLEFRFGLGAAARQGVMFGTHVIQPVASLL